MKGYFGKHCGQNYWLREGINLIQILNMRYNIDNNENMRYKLKGTNVKVQGIKI